RLQDGAAREDLRAEGTTAAVIDASFSVDEGQIFVVMGLSGSGKSTLLRMLNGLLEPTAGHVRFDGQDLTELSAAGMREVRAKKISMVFQHFALFPHRSVLENAAYGLQVQGVPREERERRATEALELAGLKGWEKSWPDELSGGMQQRVGLARALATDADLLLMDESFSALDPLIRRDMQDQLVELQKRLKKTIVFITHDLNEAMRLGDKIAVMRDGRIVQTGTAEDILVTPANDYVAAFTQDVDR
ncbi:glycine betaine/L-proline ABC transporter ATP-binding protein, partial [Streptomyces sp. NEAU-H3]